MVQLSAGVLHEDCMAILSQLDGLAVSTCLMMLRERPDADEHMDRTYAALLRERIVELMTVVPEPFFRDAIFSSKIVRVPTFNQSANRAAFYNLLVFHAIPDVHESTLVASGRLTYVPLFFFQCRQQSFYGSPHHTSFDRRLHHEFAPLIASQEFGLRTEGRDSASMASNVSIRSASMRLLERPSMSFSARTVGSPSRSLRSLGTRLSRKSKTCREDLEMKRLAADMLDTPFGGILRSQELTIESSRREVGEHAHDGWTFGFKTSAGTADVEMPTYIDELLALTARHWRSTQGERALQRR